MEVRHTLCITNKQGITEDPVQCGCVRGFFCMRVSSGDYSSKTNGPRSGATKYGILNESKQMAYLNKFFEKKYS